MRIRAGLVAIVMTGAACSSSSTSATSPPADGGAETGASAAGCAGLLPATTCGSCLVGSCCAERRACKEDSACEDCINDDSTSACASNATYRKFAQCAAGLCKTECSAATQPSAPSTWRCVPAAYSEATQPWGLRKCDCNCGAPDPDCTFPEGVSYAQRYYGTYGCAEGSYCNTSGACSSGAAPGSGSGGGNAIAESSGAQSTTGAGGGSGCATCLVSKCGTAWKRCVPEEGSTASPRAHTSYCVQCLFRGSQIAPAPPKDVCAADDYFAALSVCAASSCAAECPALVPFGKSPAVCAGATAPSTAACCACPAGQTCTANGCSDGEYCDHLRCACVAAPSATSCADPPN